jgi:hypothetical protein
VQEAVALARAGSHTANAANARGSNISGTNSRGEYAPVGRAAEDGDENEVSVSASAGGTICGRRGAADANANANASATKRPAPVSSVDHTAVEMTQSIM